MKIILLGDSIRMGYCGFVRELLIGKAEVFYPAENGRFLQYTLRQLQDWKNEWNLSGNEVDIVHWNNGLWDLSHLGNGYSGEAEAATASIASGNRTYEEEVFTPPEMYEYLLKRVHKRIRQLFPRAKVVFASTTPVLEDQPPPAVCRNNAEIRAYNDIARKVLLPEGVLFNDLYPFADKELKHLHSDWVHYSAEGSSRLAEKVVEFLSPLM